jgi:hypothetical protein
MKPPQSAEFRFRRYECLHHALRSDGYPNEKGVYRRRDTPHPSNPQKKQYETKEFASTFVSLQLPAIKDTTHLPSTTKAALIPTN